MDKVKRAGGNLTNGYWGEAVNGEATEATPMKEAPEVKMTKDGVDETITLDGLRKHENEQEPWFVLQGQVYDGTAFLEKHPGGPLSITSVAGQDATDEFMAIRKCKKLIAWLVLNACRQRDRQGNDARLPYRRVG